MSTKLIFGLDVGSSKVVSLVGILGDKVEIIGLSSYHFVNSSRSNDFTLLGNGLICEVERVGGKIAKTLHEAQISADCSAGSLITNISGNHLRNIYTSSTRELNGQPVTEEVIRALIHDARQVTIPERYEVLDYEIQEYLVDDERYTLNPLDLSCDKIKANLNLLISAKTPIANLKKAISYSGYEIAKIVPAVILSALAVLNAEEKELGCCLIDIGAGTTDLVVYEKGFIRFMASIPLGGEDITRDLAAVLKVSRNLAEDLKLTYANCGNFASSRRESEGITLTDHRGGTTTIARKLLTDVVIERVKDILSVVRNQLNSNDLYAIISSGIVVTGGGAELGTLQEFAAEYFGLPVRIGMPDYCGDFADIVCNPKYATSVGALYFANSLLSAKRFENEPTLGMELGLVFKKIKNIFKNM